MTIQTTQTPETRMINTSDISHHTPLPLGRGLLRTRPTVEAMTSHITLPATNIGLWKSGRRIILHLLHLTTNLFLQTVSNYLTTPPNRQWETLSFILFVIGDVGTLIVCLNNTCLRDDNATRTPGLLLSIIAVVIAGRPTSPPAAASGAISLGFIIGLALMSPSSSSSLQW